MQAAVVPRYGPPEVVELREVTKPEPKPNEVVVAIHATTVSAADWRMRSGVFPRGFKLFGRLALGFRGPRRPILGTELAGVVEAVGAEVRKFAVGERVFAFPATGGHAEYCCVAETGPIARMPDNLDFGQAAALSFGGTTALWFFRQAKIQRGDKVLINGASGGVGTAAVQLAKHFGAEVTGVCSTKNLELVTSLGADQVIDHTREDFTQSGERYDIIMDTAGTAGWARSKVALRPGGRLLAVLASLPDMLRSITVNLGGDKRMIVGSAPELGEDLELLAKLAETGAFMPFIERRYAFDQLVEAHRHVDGGHKRGNVVVEVVAHQRPATPAMKS